ncbi:unnamed protein product [Protopolystoma xenopodis]|uniref:Uncharacterized protein n=1 Tax=Protopolystoma xenopodis TaxID=117903 RepID=A0A3S5FEU9_9PLAT|nr:unnamed protein product [Protopolystoma xenopodis]
MLYAGNLVRLVLPGFASGYFGQLDQILLLFTLVFSQLANRRLDARQLFLFEPTTHSFRPLEDPRIEGLKGIRVVASPENEAGLPRSKDCRIVRRCSQLGVCTAVTD